MSFNLTAGNPRAHRIRVYYFGVSTIYEGMPVCYDNSTTNWFGGSMSAGEITESLTTAEGSQNEGKYIRVENPNADNAGLFAGVVAGSGQMGEVGPAAVDIYVPNGAVVPVRTDSNCLIDQTVLAITTGSQELGVPLGTDSRPVAIARETVDRGTAGLVLAELNPSRFLYQDMGGTALSIDDADTTTGTQVNYSNVNFLGSSSYNRALHMVGTINAGAAAFGMFKFRTYVTHTLTTGHAQAVCCNLHFKGDDAGLRGSNGEISAALYVTVETEDTVAADLSDGDVACIECCCYIDDGCTTPGSIYGLHFHSDTATKHVFTHLFGARHATDIGFASQSGAAVSHVIPIEIADTTYYLMVSDAA